MSPQAPSALCLVPGLLDGKTAWITGGGTGLGRAMALRFAELGAAIALCGRREEPLAATCDEIVKAGGRAGFACCDVREPKAVEAAFGSLVEQLGPVDILVNNAAGNFICPSEDLSPNGFATIVGIVLNGTFHCTRVAGRHWIDSGRKGAVLNIAATYADHGSAFVMPSACAKAGVVAMTQSLAVEWARHGIRLNAIAPGPIRTEGAFSRLLPSEDYVAQHVKRIPAGRLGTQEELAELAAYLVSDAADWMRGEVVTLDGGEWLRGAGEFNHLLDAPPEVIAGMRRKKKMNLVGRALALAALGAAAFAWAPAVAHDFSTTDVVVLFKTDGTYQIDLRVDVDALALGVSPQTDSAELARVLESLSPAEFESAVERARDTLSRRLRPRFDGAKQRPIVSFPLADGAVPEDPAVPSVLGTIARLAGRVPQEAKEFTFGASAAFNAVHVTILDQAQATGRRHILEPGANTPPYRFGETLSEPDRGQIVVDYLILGFKHIVPRGLDHMLFVLGLFLLSTQWKPLLWQISAFTVAHSVTLALAMYDVVSLPSRLVETLIALSIAYVAVENLLTSDLKPRRTALVFAFGLLHGLGFARVLTELGLPRGEFVTGLITFNVGVELGQLAVVAVAFLIVGWARERDWYRSVIVFPLSAAIALVGLYWAFQRGLGL